MKDTITISELKVKLNNNQEMPDELFDPSTKDIWFYTDEDGIKDYWNECDDSLLLKDTGDYNRELIIQSFYPVTINTHRRNIDYDNDRLNDEFNNNAYMYCELLRKINMLSNEIRMLKLNNCGSSITISTDNIKLSK